MKLDKRRKYYLILDCETATLPYASNYNEDTEAKKRIAIAKPLIYDLGWQIVDGIGRVYDKKSFLITEIFSVPSVFNTAYFKEKRPLYLEKMKKGEIVLTTWENAIENLLEAISLVDSVGAYNALFDFKKAIPFTETYINHLYSEDFSKWENFQNQLCDKIANKQYYDNPYEFNPLDFEFRDIKVPLFDLWGMSCETLLNSNEYRNACKENEWYSPSKKYYSTTAENTYRFISKNEDFDEKHTALEDAEIETEIFATILSKTKKKVSYGIIYFPFKLIGKVEEFEDF